METKINCMKSMLSTSSKAVFFGGAGVSTESGIPDFRSTDGLYRQKWKYPPEEIISRHFFYEKTEEFFEFYREKLLFPNIQPNATHYALAALEKKGYLYGVITQNIDGLHQKAGSRCVSELHGTVLKNHCLSCGKFYGMDTILGAKGIPRCSCGGVIKPDVTLYEESLPPEAMELAGTLVQGADLMIVAGTSLTVYPAASYVAGFRGKIILINKTPTPYDASCDLVFREAAGTVFSKLSDLPARG